MNKEKDEVNWSTVKFLMKYGFWTAATVLGCWALYFMLIEIPSSFGL